MTPARITTTMIERFMTLRLYSSPLPLAVDAASRRVARIGRRGVRAADAAALRRGDDRDVRGLQARLLQAVELHDRAPVGEDRLQLVVLRGCEIALRLHDEVVRR